LQASMMKLVIMVLNTACVMTVVAYILTRTKFYSEILEKKIVLQNQVLLILIFGAFTMYSAYNSIPVAGGLVSLRHTGPIVSGLLAGPLVGGCVGLIGAVDRFLNFGGPTAISASLAALLAGLFAGLYHKWKKGAPLRLAEAALFTVCFQLFASTLSFMVLQDIDRALALELKARPPLIVGNAIAVTIFVFITNNLIADTRSRAEKKRIESELNVARDIQMSLIPKTFPGPPEQPEFNIYAILESAKEVGGDLYDFYFIDDDHFCFLIGDVSGKGVPASLFMAVTRTLFKVEAGKGSKPDEIQSLVNNELCEGNDSCMFVTTFCGILNIRTGEVVYSSGGHNPPYVYRRNGNIETLDIKGVALGVMEDISFGRGEVVLGYGDAIVLFTDGVSEAMNRKDEMFTEERLIQSIQKNESSLPKDIIGRILGDVKDFVAGAEQSDDITMLALTYTSEGKAVSGGERG
jgi:phosphoserine phosphatase RsbU/P